MAKTTLSPLNFSETVSEEQSEDQSESEEVARPQSIAFDLDESDRITMDIAIRAVSSIKGGNEVAFGEYGLQAVTGAWRTARQIESARIVISRYTKKEGKVYIESNEANRKHTGRSPDENDSLVICNEMANMLLKKQTGDPILNNKLNMLKNFSISANISVVKSKGKKGLPKWL